MTQTSLDYLPDGCYEFLWDANSSANPFLKSTDIQSYHNSLLGSIPMPSDPERTIFINRNGNRRVINSEELFQALLGENQFVTYVKDMSEIKLEDQFKMVSSFDILISPHGSQLMHFFSLPKCSIVLELQMKGYFEEALGKVVLRAGFIYGAVYAFDQREEYGLFGHENHHAPYDPIVYDKLKSQPFHTDVGAVQSALSDLRKVRARCLARGGFKNQEFFTENLMRASQYYEDKMIGQRPKAYISLYGNYL